MAIHRTLFSRGSSEPELGRVQAELNTQKATNYQMTNSTMDSNTISDYAQIKEQELAPITWDIIGLSEVQRKGKGLMVIKYSHLSECHLSKRSNIQTYIIST